MPQSVPFGWTVLAGAGGGGFHKWPYFTQQKSSGSEQPLKAKYTNAAQLFLFSGALPWKHQLKLNIWLLLCSVRNESQMKHCIHGHHAGKQWEKKQGCEKNDAFVTVIKCEQAQLRHSQLQL